MGNIYTGSNSGKAGLNVKKADDTVDVFGVSQIQLGGNMTLVNNQNGSVTIDSTGGGGSGGVTELSFGSTGFLPATSQTGSIVMTGQLNVGSGGTGLSSLGSAEQILKVNAGGTALEYATLTEGTGITIAEAAGTITITADNNGTMSNFRITDGSNSQVITDGEPITFTGGTGLTSVVSATDTVTIELDDTAVTAATYTNATLTVDAQGRLTAASSGTAPATGTGTANQVTYWDSASTITGDSGLTWNPTGGSERFTITGSSAGDMLRVVSTSATTGTAPDIAFLRDRTYLAGLDLGIVLFKGPDAVNNEHTYAYIKVNATDGTVGAEKGTMDFRVGDGTGGNGYPLRLSASGAHFNVINATGLDVRMDTGSQDNAFLLDSSADTATFSVPVTINQQSNAFSTDFALQLTEDTDDANQSPDFFLYKDSPTPANGDDIGSIQFYGNNAASSGGAKNLKHLYGSIVMDMADVITNQESGRIFFQVLKAGTLRQALTIRGDGTSGSVVIGDGNFGLGADGIDFRVETTSENSAFTIDTSTDQANFDIPVALKGKINNYAGSAPTNGQLLIGDGTDFELGSLTSTGGTVTITNGAGTINLEAAGGGGTPAGATTQIQFNDAGSFGASSRLTFNSSTNALTAGSSIASTPVSFTQEAGDSTLGATVAGGIIKSTQSEISLGFGQGFALLNEIHGIKLQPTDYQVKTGKTTTQSFGQTQNTIIGLGAGAQVVDCYPSQGGLIVVTGSATAITVNLTLGQFATPLGTYDSGALPFNGGAQPTNTSDLPGYGTWQIGDQVTVLANLTVGQTPNITVRSYNSTQNGSPAIPSTAATAAPGDDPSTATKINGVLSDSSTSPAGVKTITTNFTALTFILVADQVSTLQAAWVAIG